MKSGRRHLYLAWKPSNGDCMSSYKVAVLMTSYNRRELTIKSLSSLYTQRITADIRLTTFLVSDGCTDGTEEAVRSMFNQVRLLDGDGALFWNGGMRIALDAAMRESFDAYLFLNDDTILYEGALAQMIGSSRSQTLMGQPSIMVGSIKSPGDGQHAYGGLSMRARGLELSFERVLPHESLCTGCDTMNGNFVLIPADIAEALGNLDGRFRHQFGDLDYGLRARNAGFPVVVVPGYVGECRPNSKAGTWRDPDIALAKRWKNLLSPKGVPVSEWFLFTRRHFSWRWPYYFISPYLKTVLSGLPLSKILRRCDQAATSML